MSIPYRLCKGFADGFGGGILGGLAYWGLATALGGGVVPFPVLKVAIIAFSFGFIEIWRVSRKTLPAYLPAR